MDENEMKIKYDEKSIRSISMKCNSLEILKVECVHVDMSSGESGAFMLFLALHIHCVCVYAPQSALSCILSIAS